MFSIYFMGSWVNDKLIILILIFFFLTKQPYII